MNGLLGSITKDEARMKNPLVLAYVGDTVYDLYFRTIAAKRAGGTVNSLNREVSGKVNAHSQAEAALMLEFTEEEEYIFRRGRNAKPGTMPKNMSAADYHKATGLEAVVGYLYLTGQADRLDELFTKITEGF